MTRSAAAAHPPGGRVTRDGLSFGARVAAAPIWLGGVPPRSETPGNPYNVQADVETFSNSMYW
jgi:hypothetical protein